MMVNMGLKELNRFTQPCREMVVQAKSRQMRYFLDCILEAEKR